MKNTLKIIFPIITVFGTKSFDKAIADMNIVMSKVSQQSTLKNNSLEKDRKEMRNGE